MQPTTIPYSVNIFLSKGWQPIRVERGVIEKLLLPRELGEFWVGISLRETFLELGKSKNGTFSFLNLEFISNIQDHITIREIRNYRDDVGLCVSRLPENSLVFKSSPHPSLSL